MVHYVSYGTPGGEFTQECRAAIVTEVDDVDASVGLAVLNPTGMFFNRHIPFVDPETRPHRGGSWHWPERF